MTKRMNGKDDEQWKEWQRQWMMKRKNNKDDDWWMMWRIDYEENEQWREELILNWINNQDD